MKSLMSLYSNMLADASMWCRTSTIRDLNTVAERFEDEGFSFFTITLPAFCSDFERSLDIGLVDHAAFLSFRKRRALPLFLGGLLDLVFERNDGRLRAFPDHVAIFFIRQLTLSFKKIELPCLEKRERAAFDGYARCELEVTEWSSNSIDGRLDRFSRIAGLVWNTDLAKIDRKIYRGEHVPKHGPGVTADKRFSNRKFDCVTWTERLEEGFPSADFVIPNYGYNDVLQNCNFDEPDAEQPVRVISVPKTMKTPRIIAIEPTCMQYAQQSLLELFVDTIERSDNLSGSVGFTDQAPNQRLAKLGSVDGSLATIDLSEASDRVSNLLVKRIFENHPHISVAVQACRSLRASVPGHGILPLTKYASMGSATCFPIMAMTILVVIMVGLEDSLNRTVTRADVRRLLPKVRVYGDDIIVPVDLVRYVVPALELYGLKVNVRKSFWTGKFRESCGKDYYDGSDVTVTYVRRKLPSQRSDVDEMISVVSLRNQFYKAGMWETTKFLDQLIGRLAPFPVVLERSPVLGRFSFLGYETGKISKHLHSPLVRGLVVVPKPRSSKLDGYGALLKFFLKRGVEPLQKNHLQYYGRPVAVDIKLRWSSSI